MTRQRNRITQFEIRSVQLMAACTLSLAGLTSTQSAPTSPAGAGKTALSTATGAAQTHRSHSLQTLRRLEDTLEQRDKAV